MNKVNAAEQTFANHPDVLKATIPNSKERLKALFSPYKTKVYFKSGEWGVFGMGSFTNANTVHVFYDTDKSKPSLIMGNHVEMASKTSILTGGEHYNHLSINETISNFPDIKFQLKQKGIKHQACFSRGQVHIGGNVVISLGVTILSGVTIGNGAVVGAGAVVTKDIPPFAIVAGNPSRVLKYRFDDKTIEALQKIRWWDFTLPHFLQSFEDIQKLHLPEIQEKYLAKDLDYYEDKDRCLVFQVEQDKTEQYSFLGVEVQGTFIPVSQLPEAFTFYVAQMAAPPGATIYFTKDIFKFSGVMDKVIA